MLGRMPALDPPALVGAWRLERTLLDRLTDQRGTATGTLTLSPDADGIAWAERGTVKWGGRAYDFTRGYRLTRDPDGWWMRFSDGRPFHPWTPGEWVTHPCRADLYRGRITSEGDSWRVEWDVQGPAKSQLIVTALELAHDL